MSGEQFALPDAIERMREIRRSPAAGTLIVVSAADPLNLAGIITAGDRVRAIATQPHRLSRRRAAGGDGRRLRAPARGDPTGHRRRRRDARSRDGVRPAHRQRLPSVAVEIKGCPKGSGPAHQASRYRAVRPENRCSARKPGRNAIAQRRK